MVFAASLSLRAPLARPSTASRARSGRRVFVAPRANLGQYLSEAAKQIFTPQNNSDVPWVGSGTPFSGSIVHHEDSVRLQKLSGVIEQVKQEMEASGLVDASAAEQAVATEAGEGVDGGLTDYMTQAVGRIFAHNFKGDEAEPKEWASTGYTSSWRKGSQREVQRQYTRLVRFQKVVKTALRDVDVKA